MNELKLIVNRVTVMKTDGTDIINVFFEGDAPFPGLCNSTPCFTLDVSANTAEKYIKNNFPDMTYEVINIRSQRQR